ncbi:MAG: phage head-tail connector protein [Oscillospiraceae bacterium]|nr:phage head-tail connector protein [Oscillospiraceae bacterium]
MAAIDKVKVLLGITDSSPDELLELIIAETEEYIKDYCHVKSVPAKLEGIVPFMATDLYRAKGYGSSELPSDVKSISEGARSVSYEVKRPADVFSSYNARLKKHRKGRMPSDISSVTED